MNLSNRPRSWWWRKCVRWSQFNAMCLGAPPRMSVCGYAYMQSRYNHGAPRWAGWMVWVMDLVEKDHGKKCYDHWRQRYGQG